MDDGATVGPFAYLRPDAHLHPKAKAGTFVEIKNSEIGAGTKVPHLSYIGDADIGEGTNIGAGNVTANYDGRNKHRTTIGSSVKTSVDTTFVAPGHGRRPGLHGGRHRRHARRAARGARHLARPPEEHRGLRGPQRAVSAARRRPPLVVHSETS